MSEHDFIQKFTRLAENRQCLVLTDQPTGECVFLEGNNCSVQSVKPQQCRDFPNLWNFPGFEKICRAVPKLVDADEYASLVEMATGRLPP
jgi:Fe-S-cluster containining protein